MTIETRRVTIEVKRSHIYWRGCGFEFLVDLTGAVGSSFNRV